MQFPTTIKIASDKLTNFQPSFSSESRSLKLHTRRIPASRFECMIKTPGLGPKDARLMWAFINSLGGRLSTFSVILPTHSNSVGNISGNGQVKAAVSAGNTSVVLKGLPANLVDALLPGDPIGFAGHQKVYIVKDAVTVNASGEANINLTGQLQGNVSTSETALLVNVPYYFKLRTDKSAYESQISDQGYSKFTLDCLEDV